MSERARTAISLAGAVSSILGCFFSVFGSPLSGFSGSAFPAAALPFATFAFGFVFGLSARNLSSTFKRRKARREMRGASDRADADRVLSMSQPALDLMARAAGGPLRITSGERFGPAMSEADGLASWRVVPGDPIGFEAYLTDRGRRALEDATRQQ